MPREEARRRGPNQAEVEDLRDVVHPSPPGGEDVRGLDVAVDQPGFVRFLERQGGLPQQVNGTPRRKWAVPFDEVRQAHPRQVFHDIVICPVLGPAVVEDLDRVRVRQCRVDPHFAFEPIDRPGPNDHLRADQLDGARPLQQLVLGQEDLTHSAGADPLAETVLAKATRLDDLRPQPRDRVGRER